MFGRDCGGLPARPTSATASDLFGVRTDACAAHQASCTHWSGGQQAEHDNCWIVGILHRLELGDCAWRGGLRGLGSVGRLHQRSTSPLRHHPTSMRSSCAVGLVPLSQQHLDRFTQLGNLLSALVRAPRSARLALARNDADARLELLHEGYDTHFSNSGSRWLRWNGMEHGATRVASSFT